MRAACFQFDVRTGDVDRNLLEVESGLREAHERGCDLVVLPEMWPTSFASGEGLGLSDDMESLLSATDRALEQVVAWTREMPLVVCGSAYGRTSGLPTNRWHMIEAGRIVTAYDKVHLFTPTAEDASFSSGEGPPGWADTRAGKVGGIVCYDLRFPEVARYLFRAGVEVITVSAQWPEGRVAHWEALLAGRAVESQAFVVACNRTGTSVIGRRKMELSFPGRSRIVDPDGRVVADAGGGRGLVVSDVELTVVRAISSRVPVRKDELRSTYARWGYDPK